MTCTAIYDSNFFLKDLINEPSASHNAAFPRDVAGWKEESSDAIVSGQQRL